MDVFGEKVGLRGGLVALKSLSTIKKGTSPLNFKSNEPLFKFLRDKDFNKNLYAPGHNFPLKKKKSVMLRRGQSLSYTQ